LNATETRHWLGECFNVLLGYGILEVVTPHDKDAHKATTYRYIEQGQP
jgi:hypothetical protein